MASTSEKVRPVDEEAYAPQNYADVFPELPQANPLEGTQWPAKTPAAWKTNVRPSKCTQVRRYSQSNFKSGPGDVCVIMLTERSVIVLPAEKEKLYTYFS
jgi:hypothetical protein